MSEQIEALESENKLLLDLSKDPSFDKIVSDDARALIKLNSEKIIELGGTPVGYDMQEQVGTSDAELIEKLRVKLSSFYRLRDKSDKVRMKYNTLERIFKLKTGVSFEDFYEGRAKFVYGGVLSPQINFANQSLMGTNQFFFLKETDTDPLLKLVAPENSVLYQVLLPDLNSVYALASPQGKSLALSFYKDEELTDSLDYTFTMSAGISQSEFEGQYLEMARNIEEIIKKSY